MVPYLTLRGFTGSAPPGPATHPARFPTALPAPPTPAYYYPATVAFLRLPEPAGHTPASRSLHLLSFTCSTIPSYLSIEGFLTYGLSDLSSQRTVLRGAFHVHKHCPRPKHSLPLPCFIFHSTFGRRKTMHLSLGERNSRAGAYLLPALPAPLPQTHQVAQLGRLLLVIVQPSQGAGPVFVHPEAHDSWNSRG